MRSLLDKIKDSAAERLILPAGRKPAQELARYKTFLKVESHRLKILHRGGAGGRQICQGLSAAVDALLCHLLESVKNVAGPAPTPAGWPKMSLVAIGGYGRGELNPQSDIDLMFLHPFEAISRKNPHPYLTLVTEGLLYDLGLKVGYSVRSVADCVNIASTDMQSKTALLEARLVSGDPILFEQFQHNLLAKCVREHEDEYIEARLQDQSARHAKFGNSATMQEPNIKSGCGGLRDYQNLHWMAFVKYRTHNTAEMEKQGLISSIERRHLDAAYDFLLRTRNELHYQVNRPVDVLGKNVQPAVALRLGYSDRSPSKRIEEFLKDYYTHSRHIYLITQTVEQRLALQPKPRRFSALLNMLRRTPVETEQAIDGFKITAGKIQGLSTRIFDDAPRRMIRVFLYAQQRGLDLHPDLIHLIRAKLSLVNRSFLGDSHVRETFLEILNQRGNIAPILRVMHDAGFLGKLIPEFGRLTNLVQHEFYHQYTADAHTLVCLAKLDDICTGKDPAFAFYTELSKKVERPYLLYLALLLHDAGKGGPHRKHEEAGAAVAQSVAARLHLDAPAADVLSRIVKSHLLMAQVSQRRDLGDAAVIRKFAQQIQTEENLTLLTLHTVADTLATSDKLWNDFKDQLIQMLHDQTSKMLSGNEAFLRSAARQQELLAEEIRRSLPRGVTEEEMRAHFTGMPPRYFQAENSRQILAGLTLTHRFMSNQMDDEEKALEPVVYWHNEPDRGYTEVKVCTWDRARLFSKIAGAFSATGLNILNAQIFTRSDAIVLDTFYITDASTGNVANREEREQFEKLLVEVLTQKDVDLAALIAKHKGARPIYQSHEGEPITTKVRIYNELSDTLTVIEVETEDRVGLLYAISHTLADLDLNIGLAKIFTEKGAAIDSFYVSYAEGGKILLPEQQATVGARIREAIQRLDV